MGRDPRQPTREVAPEVALREEGALPGFGAQTPVPDALRRLGIEAWPEPPSIPDPATLQPGEFGEAPDESAMVMPTAVDAPARRGTPTEARAAPVRPSPGAARTMDTRAALERWLIGVSAVFLLLLAAALVLFFLR